MLVDTSSRARSSYSGRRRPTGFGLTNDRAIGLTTSCSAPVGGASRCRDRITSRPMAVHERDLRLPSGGGFSRDRSEPRITLESHRGVHTVGLPGGRSSGIPRLADAFLRELPSTQCRTSSARPPAQKTSLDDEARRFGLDLISTASANAALGVPKATSSVEGQRGAILSKPKLAPSGSLTIAKRPPGKSCGASSSRAPRSSAFRWAASTSSTAK